MIDDAQRPMPALPEGVGRSDSGRRLSWMAKLSHRCYCGPVWTDA